MSTLSFEVLTPQLTAPPILTGQKAIVTGASSGVGQGIAISLAQAGADVIVNYNRGEKGAIALGNDGYCQHPGYRVTVQDTIGSGDAFLAGYLSQWLADQTPIQCLDFACRMGAFVATQRGGTPRLDPSELSNFLPTQLV